MTQRPVYRTLAGAPGQYFDCTLLRATLTVTSCAQRWQAATEAVSVCQRCPIGALHASTSPCTTSTTTPTAPRRRERATTTDCVRCGRSDLRLVQAKQLCLSCYNREAEWTKGCNAKGKAPITFTPLRAMDVAVTLADGTFERRRLMVRHQAEAVGLTSRGMAGGEQFADGRPGHAAWSAATGCFEYVCGDCGTQGLVLERSGRLEHLGRGGQVRHHCWACQGEPEGGAEKWTLAQVREQVVALDVESAAAYLAMDPEMADQPASQAWTLTAWPCEGCGVGQVEARSLGAGRWACRCRSCCAGAESPV